MDNIKSIGMLVKKMIRLGTKNILRVMPASGAWASTRENMDNIINKWKFNTVVSKTCTMDPKSGNPIPNFVNFPAQQFSINCMGMPNYGYTYYRNLLPYFNSKGITYILSVDGGNFLELIGMLDDYSIYIKSPEIVEINLSCPNTLDTIPSYSLDYFEKLLEKLKYRYNNLHIGLKLSPMLDPHLILKISILLGDYATYDNSITHIVCSNSIPNGIVFDKNNKPVLSAVFGGVSGFPAKLIAQNNVFKLSKILEPSIKIIGCGGVENHKDVAEYLNMGAAGVQIGRAIYTDILKPDFCKKYNQAKN